MMEIMVKCSDVVNYGKKIENYSSELQDNIKKFNMLIESINEIWDGADALKYINVMREKYVVGLQEIKSILDDYGTYLKKVADAYSALDESYFSKVIDV